MAGKLNPGLLISFIVLLLASGCAQVPVNVEQQEFEQGEEEAAPPAQPALKASQPGKKPAGQTEKNLPTVRRVITEKELRQLAEKNPDLEFYRCLEILCRLNKKDKEYIREDMKKKRPIAVPKNFSAYMDWSPLPRSLTGAGKFPKLILVVKDIAFLGWYKNGKLVGDTYVCVGKMNTWTKRGIYRVNAKDPSHMSTYPNAYGYPSFMPWALHVYDRVWIHAGDVIGPNCSHGCINVPIAHADVLYNWADIGTAVVITESLRDLGRDIKTAQPANQPPKAPSAKDQGKDDKKLKSGNEMPKQSLGNSSKAATGGGI
jgi:lipoprotein-anchoring transpeptidase ErfK/SrfK